jgi:CheY-like chemotaxis protein
MFEEMRLAEAGPSAPQTVRGPETPDPADDRDDNLSYGTETILLVDDERFIIDVARDMLEFLGYRVIIALSGREAIDIYEQKKEQIDLVIQDMVMPVIDGAAVFAALKQMNPYVKVILASGYVYNEKISTVMEQGCRAFMPKPFRLEDLSAKVREVLDSP